MSLSPFFNTEALLEENKINDEDVENIKQFLMEEDLPKLNKEQIILFLLSCEKNMEFTKETIKSHYRIKKEYPKYFSNRNVDRADMQYHFNNCADFAVLPRTEDGSAVLYSRQYNGKSLNLDTFVTMGAMVLDCVIYDERYDRPPTGIIIIANMNGYSLQHVLRFRYTPMKAILLYVQYGLPLKLKGIYVFNTNYFVEKVVSLVSPFLKKSVTELMHFFPQDIDIAEVNKYISSKSLPAECGGSQPSWREFYPELMQRLKYLQKYFKDEEEQWNRA